MIESRVEPTGAVIVSITGLIVLTTGPIVSTTDATGLAIGPTGPVTEPTTDATGLMIGSTTGRVTWAMGSGVAFAEGFEGVMPAPSVTWTGGFGWPICATGAGFGLTDTGGLGTVRLGLTDGIEGFGWWTCGTTVGLGLTVARRASELHGRRRGCRRLDRGTAHRWGGRLRGV